MDETDDYSTIMENVAKEYGPKALALLERIRGICLEDGLTANSAPFDMSADEYSWALTLSRVPDEADNDLIAIEISIYEEREYNGGDGFGLNFGLTITERGGRELGQLQPYNYTEKVWVDSRDPDAVAERWQILEDADQRCIPALINRCD